MRIQRLLMVAAVALLATACVGTSGDDEPPGSAWIAVCVSDGGLPVPCLDGGVAGDAGDGGMSSDAGDGGGCGDAGDGGGCGDAGSDAVADAGTVADAAVADAAVTDAGTLADAGTDAAMTDAAMTDAAMTDAAMTDARTDAATDARTDAATDANITDANTPDACVAQPPPPPPSPPPGPPVDLAAVVGATTRSPVYVVEDQADWLTQALAIVDNSYPGTSSAMTNAPNTVDITSLGCFSARNAAPFARAIARRLYDNLTIRRPALTIAPTRNPVRIRMAFAQRASAGGLGANNNYTAICLTNAGTFLTLLDREFKALLMANLAMNAAAADLWMRQHRNVLMNGATPELTVDIAWVAWGGGTVAGDNWNHSKIVTNGAAALVGGSNLYDEYRPPEVAPVVDRDLLVWGAAASAARAWNNTLWRDYAGRDPRQYYHLNISNVAAGPRFTLVTLRTALTTATTNNAYPYVVAAPTVNLDNPEPAGQGDHVATPVPTYSGGVKGVSFTNSANNGPNTPAAVNAYDLAIGNLLRAAIRPDRVLIRISQQDFANSSVSENGPEHTQSYIATGAGQCLNTNLANPGHTSYCATAHRAALVQLLAQAVSALPPNTVPTVVRMLKSQGAGYTLEATMAQQMAGLKERVLTQSLVRNNPGGNAKNKNRVKALRGTRFNAIVTAKGTGAQRLHTKFVAVDLPDQHQVAASVGSLNLYNARMMHDYGNIIVGSPNDEPQATLRAQFDAEFAGAPNTIVADARVPAHCDPSWSSQPVVANLTDPTTPFGSQVDLSQGLTWVALDVAAQPSLQIEQYGHEAFAEVAVSTDCDGDLVLSEEDGMDGWNYDAAGMSFSSASMPPPPPGTSCSLRLLSQGSQITATLTCGASSIAVSIYSLAAASAYRVTPETATGYLAYTAGTCASVASTEYP